MLSCTARSKTGLVCSLLPACPPPSVARTARLPPCVPESPFPRHPPAVLQVKKRDIIALQDREETGFTWQSMIEAGYIE